MIQKSQCIGNIVAMDLGSGYTKAVSDKARIIFPSLIAFRHAQSWEEHNDGLIEGIGESALDVAKFPNAIIIRPISEGRPEHDAFLKLSQEALRRLKVDQVSLVSGLPFDMNKKDRERIKETLKESLRLTQIALFPQGLGTLFDLDLDDGIVLNCGHNTVEVLAIENLQILTGSSLPLANDYILQTLTQFILREYGFKPDEFALQNLVIGNINRISGMKTEVARKDIEKPLENSVSLLADTIAHQTRSLLNQLPHSNLACLEHVILSGGGSLLRGFRQQLQQALKMKVTVHPDPLFSNCLGFMKAGLKLWGQK